MIYYVVLGFSFLIVAFFIRYFRFDFYHLAEYSVALLDTLIADTDEDAKIKEISKSNKKLMLAFLHLFKAIFFAFAAGSLPIIAYAFITHTSYNQLAFSSFAAIVSISAGATIPFLIPLQKNKTSDYSELSQLLHAIALDNYNIALKLFKRDAKRIEKNKLTLNSKFVIISGLARAGTTSLMNDLSRIDDFVSLNYANMPFVLSPNIWRKFYKPKTEKLKERSHKDGIMIGYDSNEALEEFFFKAKAKDAYITDKQLTEYQITSEDYTDYLRYQSIIKRDNNKFYLAKNNNFILRYKSVREQNPDFIMVILFRDPLKHATSLMDKHKDYKKMQQEDAFVLRYMNWLGHHEFGLNQKPFVFNNSLKIDTENKDHLDYWLAIWINYYSYILTIDHPNTLLINYDTFCQKPRETVTEICKNVAIKSEIPEYTPFINKRESAVNHTDKTLEKAQIIYEKLKERAMTI